MKRLFALLGVCAALGAFSVPAPAQAVVNIGWGENISWGGVGTTSVTYGSVTLPAGTRIGISLATTTTVYVWARITSTSTPFVVAIEDKAIWGV